MLVGREDELRRIDLLLAGSGGALLLEGEPGIGKTALLDEAVRRAGGRRTLRAAGAEGESHLPFAALATALAPLAGLLDEVPAAQAAALRAALALDEGGGAGDRVALLHGVRSLVEAAAGGGALLLVVDDLAWVDRPSAEAFAFLARRARGVGVPVLLARRPVAEPPPDGIPVLRLGPLERRPALMLLDGAGLAPPVAERVVEAAGGNPLALREIPGELTPAQRRGGAPLDGPLPAGPTLEALYRARLDALPAATREATLLAAAGRAGDTAALASALPDRTALGPAETAGLVSLAGGDVRFRHPLVRSAAYHGAPPAARRAAHRRLAEHAAPVSAAWHRAAAADGPDEDVAAALAALAAEAVARGAPGAAADALERAAALSPAPGARWERSLGAAYAALVAGRLDQARRLADALLPEAASPGARCDVQRLRAGAILLAGHPARGMELLLAEVPAVEAHDPARAAALLTDAGVAHMASGDMRGMAELARRAIDAAERARAPTLVPRIMLAEAHAVRAEHDRTREILAGLEEAAPLPRVGDPEILAVAGLCFLWLEEYERGASWLDGMIADARRTGVFTALPMPLSVRACVDIRRGRLDLAGSHAREAVEIAEVAAAGFALAFALSTEATVLAWTGDEAGCRARAERARALAAAFGMHGPMAYCELALTTLELGLERAGAAAEHARRGAEAARDYGVRDPSFLQDGANLVEAAAREGDRAEAARALAALEDAGARTGGAWPRAAVERCRGLLAADGDFDTHFQRALAHHDAGPAMPLERARTLLCHGERLRRARRRGEARTPLSAAERTFARLGAASWAARARRELAAAGGSEVAPQLDLDGLTPQEREVCRLVAAGASNREVASALFVSVRTVEYHLGNAYRKLGLRSRSQLAAMARTGG